MGGKVVALWGAKGGVGCTLLAAGLASAWRHRGAAVALVGVGPGSGDELALLTGGRIPLPAAGREDGGPLRWPDLLATLGPEGRVVVDCASRETALLRTTALAADVVGVVGTPDVFGLRSLVRGRGEIMRCGLEERRIGLVLNRSGLADGLAPAEIRAALGGRWWGTLPDAPNEVAAMIASRPGRPKDGPWAAALEALVSRIEEVLGSLPALPRAGGGEASGRGSAAAGQLRQEALRELVQRLCQAELPPTPAERRRRVTEEAAAVVEGFAEANRLPRRDVETLVVHLVDEVLGLGALEDLIKDSEVTEIMINGPTQVYVEKGGQLRQVPCQFASAEEITRLVDRIIGPLGRRIDESSPMVDARLADGSRLNAVIPPLALNGPLVTIRRFGVRGLTMDDLVEGGTLSRDLAQALERAVAARANLLLSGGAGTGKTTLLNALSGFIPAEERIITIEDAAELRLQQQHVVRLEARPPNVEGQGAVTIRDLVRNALRMRPDRIIIGEVRGAEALDMLQAMNTGHSGSLATIHANSAHDALSRLETMVLLANVALPLKVVREQIASAIDFIVQLGRQPGGGRQVVEVQRLTGLAGGRYQTRRWVSGEAGRGEAAEA
jgi:pilus assembly protein CpaF